MVTSKAKAGLSLADREMVAMGQELKNLAQKEYYRRFVEALELRLCPRAAMAAESVAFEKHELHAMPMAC